MKAGVRANRGKYKRPAFDSEPLDWVSPEDWRDYLPVESDDAIIARVVRGEFQYSGLPYHTPEYQARPGDTPRVRELPKRQAPKPPPRPVVVAIPVPQYPPPVYIPPVAIQPEPYRLYIDSPPLSSARYFECERTELQRIKVDAQAIVGMLACGYCRVRELTAILAEGLLGWNVEAKLWLFGTVCGNCERCGLFAWPDPRGYEPRTVTEIF